MTCRIFTAIIQRTVVPFTQLGMSQGLANNTLHQLGHKKSTPGLLHALYLHRFRPLIHSLSPTLSARCVIQTIPFLNFSLCHPRGLEYSLKTCRFVLLYPNLIPRSCPFISCPQSKRFHENRSRTQSNAECLYVCT